MKPTDNRNSNDNVDHELKEVLRRIWNGEYGEGAIIQKMNKVLKNSQDLVLKNVEGNLDKIRKTKRHPEIHQFIQWVEKNSSTIFSSSHLQKSQLVSDTLRIEANDLYKGKQFTKAFKGYTLSICFAAPNSKEMFLSLSNRSACSMEMKLLNYSLTDIDKAIEILEQSESLRGDDKVLMVEKKLKERKERILSSQNFKTDEIHDNSQQEKPDVATNFFALKEPSDCIESAEKFVTIEENETRGRHVKVTQDVGPGTLVILEKPFSKVLVNGFKWEMDFCHHCFKEISIYPSVVCPDCVFGVYCDDECRLSATSGHIFDCQMSNVIHELSLKRVVLLSYKTLLTIEPKELYELWRSEGKTSQSTESTNNAILGFNENGKYLSSSYYQINRLIYHLNALTEYELRDFCVYALLIALMLSQRTDFFQRILRGHKEDCKEDELRDLMDFTSSLILLHLMNFPCNVHSLYMLQISGKRMAKSPSPEEIVGGVSTDFGAGAFSLLSMINHSCDPNVTRISLDNGKIAVLTIRSLKAGEEILDNYGSHFALEPASERQAHLKDYYNFICNCTPCLENWPTMNTIQKLSARFICENCTSSELISHGRNSIDKDGKCAGCGTIYNTTELRRKLDEYESVFQEGYDLVLANNAELSIDKLISAMKYFESHVLLPFATYNYAQETLKHAYKMISSKISIKT